MSYFPGMQKGNLDAVKSDAQSLTDVGSKLW